MASCNRTKSKGEFCANAADGDCECGNDYVKVCKPTRWATYSFDVKMKVKGKKVTAKKVFEAHHILCAASVGKMIVDAKAKGVPGIVRDTTWCINRKGNMIALPLWGHTVKWYLIDNAGAAKPPRPPFKDLPQHDWDHGAYQKEVDTELKKIVKNLKDAGHKGAKMDLAGALQRLSGRFKGLLKDRGQGTHQAWTCPKPNATWHQSFSMASKAKATRRGFPRNDFKNQTKYKLKWLVGHGN